MFRVAFDEDGVNRLRNAIDGIVAKYGKPAVIFIDTVARSMPSGADENSNKDMQEFIDRVDDLGKHYRASVCFVLHTGHSSDSQKRARGASAFRASLDFEFSVDKKGNFTCTKMKEAEEPPAKSFTVASYEESAVVKYDQAPLVQQKIKLSKGDEQVLTVLTKLACAADDGVVYRDKLKEAYGEGAKRLQRGYKSKGS